VAPSLVVRKVAIDVLTSVVMRTPVGNPEIWAANRVAVNYNAEVAAHNSALRADPANLTKAGHLRPGRKLHDSMDFVAPAGYVGGRMRAAWNVSIGAPDTTTTDAVDPQGQSTIDRGISVIVGAEDTQNIYLTNSVPYAVSIEYGHSG
jgi:hypothetical protein